MTRCLGSFSLVLLIGMVLPRAALAQVHQPVGVFRQLRMVAVEFGVSQSSLAPSHGTFTPKTGLMAGLLVAGENTVTWQVEVLVASKGARAALVEINSWYVEVPVCVRLNFRADRRAHPFVFAGLAPSWTVRDNLGNLLRMYDLGVTVGGGVDFRRWAVLGRYTRGVVSTHLEMHGSSTWNESFALALAWTFK